jgi:nucleotide-binding universal stress UspA family protein
MSHGWAGIFGAMGLTFIAFEGYEIIAQTSEEVEDPKRNVPRAVFLSLLIVIPIYLLVAVVAIGAATPGVGQSVTDYLGEQKETALVAIADQVVRGGGIVLLVGGLLSTISALNATIYSSSRVAFAMARDASLPQIVSRVHPKRATPHMAILFSTLLIMVMAVALPIEEVAASASVMFLLLFGGVNIAVLRLRKSHPELDRGFRIPFMPLIPILAIVTMLFVAVFVFFAYPVAWLAAGGWIAAGAVFYYGYSRKRETAFGERTAWMQRIESKEYRVLVGISSPRTAETLMETAVALARKHDGELVIVSVSEVPEGQSLLTGRPGARALEPLLLEAVAYARDRGVTARPVIKIGRRISQALVQTAREESCNFLILGRPHTQSFFERLVSSIVERVLQDAPCQVGVVYGDVGPTGVTGVVVPLARGANSRLAAELAPAYAEWFKVPTRALTVIGGDTESAEAARLEAEARETLDAAAFEGDLKVLRRRDIGRGVPRAIRRGELVIIGAPSSGPAVPLWGDTIPALIAARRRNPVIVVRNVEEHRSGRFERVFFARR